MIELCDINELFTELRPSTICEGVGVFAIRDIDPNTDIFRWCRKDVFLRWNRVTDDYVEKFINRVCHVNEEGFYISDHPVNLGMSYYINHSTDPNVAYDPNNDTYYTTKHISRGQELLALYTKEEQDWLT